MKLKNIFSAMVVSLAILLAVGSGLLSRPERGDGVAESINLPLHNPSPRALGRDDAGEIVFEEDFENDAEGWETSDQTNTVNAWHKSDFLARGQNDALWWCGDTITDYDDDYIGYNNVWLQYLDTPALDLSEAGNNLSLTFDAYWLLEDPRRVPPPQGWDGWDGWLALVSIDGGESFSVLQPQSPAYTAEHLSAAERFWMLQGDWPGWVFESKANGRQDWDPADDVTPTPDWVQVTFDISDYRRADVVLRFMLVTDRTVSAPFNPYLANSGVLIDNLLIRDADNRTFLSNNADDDPLPAELIPSRAPGFGDTWALTRQNVHTGSFSMWNDDDNWNVINALDSPPFDVPEGFNTHVEFWVRCDMPDAVHANDPNGRLRDYWHLLASNDDGATWTSITYDYNRPEAGGDDWVHYVPGVPYVGNMDLSLSAYAGQQVRLRWLFYADNDDQEGNGTGLFLDDIQVIAENRQPRDAGMADLFIPYPNTVRLRTPGVTAKMINYGTRDLAQIWSYWGWTNFGDYRREYRILPYPSVVAGDTLPIDLSDYADRQVRGWTPLFPGVFTVYAKTAVGAATPQDPDDDDQYRPNDSTGIAGVRVWPVGLYELGHDNRTIRFAYEFASGTGAAVRFSPPAGVQNYAIASAHFRFNGGQEAPATFTLHVLAAGGNEAAPGQELLSFDVAVPPDSCLPNHMTVPLMDRQALDSLNGDFWLWAEINTDDGRPQIVGDELRRGDGRFFEFDGQRTQAYNADLMMHAMVLPAANVAPNLAETEQLLDFGEVVIDESVTRSFSLYSTGRTEVTVRNVSANEDAFVVDWPGPATLRTGQAVTFTITFTPPDDQIHADDLVIESTDETPPEVTIVGGGTLSAPGDETPAPRIFGLAAPYPNPFNSRARVEFTLDRTGGLTLGLYDLAGRMIEKLAEGVYPAGRHAAMVTADDLPAGLYLLRLESAGRTASQKVLLVK